MKLSQAIKYMGASAPDIDPAMTECEVVSFVIDSRSVTAGDVFFALSQPEYRDNGFNGDFEDATQFVASAFEAGAIACVVRRDRFGEHREKLAPYENRLVFVDDAIKALQDLAHAVYLNWNRSVVAITGSAGKTTAKELTAHVLRAKGLKVLANIKNFNNGLGHPLTVLNLAKDDSYDVAVLEMGMSTPLHEIERLCRITPPDVAVELNVLPVHVEHLGSIENVSKAKAELVLGMKDGGTAVLNADDQRVLAMRELAKGLVVTYAIDAPSDIRAESIRFGDFGETSFRLSTPGGSAEVQFPLMGRHNVSNALAAAATGHVFGMTANEISSALATAAAPQQRGEIVRFPQGFTIINDSYNSNPAALLSMVATLRDYAQDAARRIVIAGEMLELGPESPKIHRETGEELGAGGIDIFIGVRGLARELAEGARSVGIADVRFAEDSDAAGELLCEMIREGDVVLIKGSRGVRTEKVLEKLFETFETEKSVTGEAVM